MKSYDGEFRDLREFLGPPTGAAPGTPAESAPPPAQVGKYRLLRELGRGGMAIVYEAEDTELRRRVALKVLREPQADAETIRRMQREAVIAAGLKHPHIVAVHDVGMSGDAYYIAMDLVEGGTLAGRMADGRPRPDLLRWLEETARAAAHAHSQGVVHRDLKPSNVLVDCEGRAILTDFGLARAESFASQLTRSSELLGTPRYMAPEQVAGKAQWVDGRTDVYAMGVILYEMLTGRPPFSAATPARLYEQILTEDPARLGPSVDPSLEAICLKAMEKNRVHRYASALEFAEDLRNFRAGEPIRAKRVSSWHRLARKAIRSRTVRFGGVVLLALLVVAGGAFSWALVKKQRLDRRRHESLQRLGTIWSTIIERKNEVRQAKIDPERGRRELAATVRSIDDHIRDWPDEPQGYYVRARGKLYLNDPAGAERDIRIALARTPDFRPGWWLLGVIKTSHWHRQSGYPTGDARSIRDDRDERSRQAAEAFSRAGEPGREKEEFERWGLTWTREDWVMRQVARAIEFLITGRLDEANAFLKESYAEFQSEEFILWFCLTAADGDDRAAQERWTRRFVESAPGDPDAHRLRAAYHFSGRDYREAVESCSAAIRLEPNFAPICYFRGMARDRLGDHDGALADFDRAIGLDPNFALAYEERGCVKVERREYDGAIDDFDRALALDGTDASFWHNRGAARIKMGDFGGAVSDLDRALEIQPNYAQASLNRGIAKCKLGDREGALRDFRSARDLAPPGTPFRADAERLIAEIEKTTPK